MKPLYILKSHVLQWMSYNVILVGKLHSVIIQFILHIEHSILDHSLHLHTLSLISDGLLLVPYRSTL